MLFDVDEPVSPGQIVRLNANGAVEPYRPFKHVVLKNGRQHARYTTTICSLGLKEVHVLPDAPVLTYARAATCRVLAYARATTCPFAALRSDGRVTELALCKKISRSKPLQSYAPAELRYRSTLLSTCSAMPLRTCYAIPGTDAGYGTARDHIDCKPPVLLDGAFAAGSCRWR
eukprot:1853243-Rhodomonas_salina.2